MIPKTIHYCWFGRNPKPELAIKCINSWKRLLPDYEIIEWNEDNYSLENAPIYVKQAYESKKWAFVSDYVRFDLIYRLGGIYFDTDVEIIRPIDDIIAAGAFMGCQRDAGKNQKNEIAPGLGIAAPAGLSIYKEIIDSYFDKVFINADGSMNLQTVVVYVTEILVNHGLKNTRGVQTVDGIIVYPSEYFCPLSFDTKRLHKTKNTRTIHWFDASWWSPEYKDFFEKHRKEKKKAYLKRKANDFFHLPNRVAYKLLGEQKYNRIIRKVKRK